jgi:cytochrome c peroxidase
MNPGSFRSTRHLAISASVAAFVGLAAWDAAAQALPPPPVPPQNPITESKRVLGKILFWEEQLSSPTTTACGTCHAPTAGGGDARLGLHPGPDGVTPSPDDRLASPGVVHANVAGAPIADPLFGFGVQVTARAANSTIGAAYAPSLFWDGRAGAAFVDPETGLTRISGGGALESQSVVPILSTVEMAREGRTWGDVRFKLQRAQPLRDATDLPPDVAAALASGPGYPDLFAAAFGDPAITAERIAFAIATYERTLVPDRTPWDRFVTGDPTAMSPGQVQGWNFFNGSPCRTCHTPPTFSNHGFHNIGVRPPAEDLGRQGVTGLPQDRGRFKVPTLRNVGRKPTHMHNGRVATVGDSIQWYRPNNPDRSPDNLDPLLPVGVPPDVFPALVDFLSNALTDPRVAAAQFPFDRPTLHGGALPRIDVGVDRSTLSWPALQGVQRYRVYRGTLASLRATDPDGLPSAGFGDCISADDPDPADNAFVDAQLPAPGEGYFYLKSVVDGGGAERGLGATSEGIARFVFTPCPN